MKSVRPKLFTDLLIQCRMDDVTPQRLSPDELREMADTSGDPVIRRALETLAQDVEDDWYHVDEEER